MASERDSNSIREEERAWKSQERTYLINRHDKVKTKHKSIMFVNALLSIVIVISQSLGTLYLHNSTSLRAILVLLRGLFTHSPCTSELFTKPVCMDVDTVVYIRINTHIYLRDICRCFPADKFKLILIFRK